LFLQRLAVDFGGYQAREQTRSLRVTDEHNAATLVLMLQIVIPRIQHVA